MQEFLAQLGEAMVPVLATALTGLITVGIAYLSGLVKKQFGEQAQQEADRYLMLVEEAAFNAVVSLQQSTVDALKAEGAWNKATAEKVKGEAVRQAVAALGGARKGIEARLKVDLPRYMEGAVEKALMDLKTIQNPSQQG